jgi:hypothetical protein
MTNILERFAGKSNFLICHLMNDYKWNISSVDIRQSCMSGNLLLDLLSKFFFAGHGLRAVYLTSDVSSLFVTSNSLEHELQGVPLLSNSLYTHTSKINIFFK